MRLHHNAFVVRNHECNRRFLEDELGIPLVATWCEENFNNEFGREFEFCLTLFGLEDGGALAFFQFADREMYELCQAQKPAKVGRDDHIACKVERATYEAITQKAEGRALVVRASGKLLAPGALSSKL
jgi:glyoxylase I family protein